MEDARAAGFVEFYSYILGGKINQPTLKLAHSTGTNAGTIARDSSVNPKAQRAPRGELAPEFTNIPSYTRLAKDRCPCLV